MASVVVQLPVELVARYRAVDREVIGSALVDTPRYLDELTEDIRIRGVSVPLRLGFNTDFAVLDGNHRIAAALRLGLSDVPVELVLEPVMPRPAHGHPIHADDLAFLEKLVERTSGA